MMELAVDKYCRRHLGLSKTGHPRRACPACREEEMDPTSDAEWMMLGKARVAATASLRARPTFVAGVNGGIARCGECGGQLCHILPELNAALTSHWAHSCLWCARESACPPGCGRQ